MGATVAKEYNLQNVHGNNNHHNSKNMLGVVCYMLGVVLQYMRTFPEREWKKRETEMKKEKQTAKEEMVLYYSVSS